MSTKLRYRAVRMEDGYYVGDRKSTTGLTLIGPVKRIVAELDAAKRNAR